MYKTKIISICFSIILLIMCGCSHKPMPEPTPSIDFKLEKLDTEQEAILSKLGMIKTFEGYAVNTFYEKDKNNKIIKKSSSNVYVASKMPGKNYIKTIEEDGKPSYIRVINIQDNIHYIYIPSKKLAQYADLSRLNYYQREYMKNNQDLLWSTKLLFGSLKMKHVRDEKYKNKNLKVFRTNETLSFRKFPGYEIQYEEYWINPGDGITYRYLAFDKQGQVILENDTKQVKLNKPLDDKLFSFLPPKGYKIIDITKVLEKNLFNTRYLTRFHRDIENKKIKILPKKNENEILRVKKKN